MILLPILGGKYLCEGSIFFDKNLNLEAKYIGLEYYRRTFNENSINLATNLTEDSCIVYEHYNLSDSNQLLLSFHLAKISKISRIVQTNLKKIWIF